MRVSRIYTSRALESACSVTLEPETSHYLVRVLRLRSGRSLVVFNGDGSEYAAVVKDAHPTHAVVLIGERRVPTRESPLCISLGQGVSRGERMDFVLQKSVELGVASVTPLWTRHAQIRLTDKRLEKRLAHWRGIVRSACEQSGRAVLPELHPARGLSQWLAAPQSRDVHHKLVLDPSATVHLKELDPAMHVSILVGPEGGLDDEELLQATSQGFERIRLGPRVLRTETATIAVLAALQTLWGDFSA
ncbi:MAG: 16S rRNA (uracil(1498)-N(3))-methyltransferase [Gammaproteobacteria bacterium]|jgi:16S rRNA (uracil1498-N3)-methyltransferase